MNIWKQFPENGKLQKLNISENTIPEVNGHIHTPYSFSAFKSVEEAMNMAKEEGIKALGINDFYSCDGYKEFTVNAVKQQIFPLFNIEFVGLSKEEQDKQVKINDPNNPGRIYLSGKGLAFPSILPKPYIDQLEKVKSNANAQVEEMCTALNKHLELIGIDIKISYTELEKKFTKGIVRERHLAQALREEVYNKYADERQRIEALQVIFGGKVVKSKVSDKAAIENEIRGNLLKSGGAAFIPENPKQFLSLEEIRDLIIQAGGIPCYPLLADSVNGGYTEFEEDKEELLNTLINKGIYAIEFIPNRNSSASLEEYAEFFTKKGFLVSMGSEHNTPDLIPIKLCDKEGNDLSDKIKRINFEGAAIIAAHQYLIGIGNEGFLDKNGEAILSKRESLIELGSSLINTFNTAANEFIKL